MQTQKDTAETYSETEMISGENAELRMKWASQTLGAGGSDLSSITQIHKEERLKNFHEITIWKMCFYVSAKDNQFLGILRCFL